MRRVGITFVVLLAAVSMGVGASVDPYVVEVDGSSVTVGEVLLPGMGCEADDPDLGRVLVAGLRPGERRVLAPGEVHLRLTEAGVDAAAHDWVWSRAVAITRQSQVVSAGALVQAGEAGIREELALLPGDEAVVTPVMFPRGLLAPVGEIELVARVRRPALRGGLWVVTVSVQAGNGSAAAVECVIRYRVKVMADVLVTCGSVGRHETVDAGAVRVERREITSVRGDVLRGPEGLGRRERSGAEQAQEQGAEGGAAGGHGCELRAEAARRAWAAVRRRWARSAASGLEDCPRKRERTAANAWRGLALRTGSGSHSFENGPLSPVTSAISEIALGVEPMR